MSGHKRDEEAEIPEASAYTPPEEGYRRRESGRDADPRRGQERDGEGGTRSGSKLMEETKLLVCEKEVDREGERERERRRGELEGQKRIHCRVVCARTLKFLRPSGTHTSSDAPECARVRAHSRANPDGCGEIDR